LCANFSKRISLYTEETHYTFATIEGVHITLYRYIIDQIHKGVDRQTKTLPVQISMERVLNIYNAGMLRWAIDKIFK